MKSFSVNFTDKTFGFLSQQDVPNRSDYLEQLVLRDWAAMDCGHDEANSNCPSCYARHELKIQKPRKDVSDKSNLQLLRQQLCSKWLTDDNFAKAHQILQTQGVSARLLDVAEQQAVFLRVPFTYWGVYIAGLTLTLNGQTTFGAKDLRTKLQSLLGGLWDTPGAKAGSVLPGDAADGSKYADGYDCLQIVSPGKRPTYCWIGFRSVIV